MERHRGVRVDKHQTAARKAAAHCWAQPIARNVYLNVKIEHMGATDWNRIA